MDNQKNQISIDEAVHTSIQKVWDSATLPEHIVKWIFASEDWHSPKAENDPKEGGTFLVKMGPKDGSSNYDFTGKYKSIIKYKKIEYIIPGNREVKLLFEDMGETINVNLTFQPESTSSFEIQKNVWKAILKNFKKYTETL